ncbi:glutathione S-transferase family protein [Roseibium polysiphoniae]|uniref:Glutathione S-transferase family protein n=1 Tax=Roseibium polysiphoniae TaxID=2571221 RepID=A0A944CCN0_9HYPH|nr:glutathione S-transferase family protein [Roseibium polysiphoniae]MBS8260503.1 glutathione S-transferase family protein [Roseibium polysiphoniae]
MLVLRSSPASPFGRKVKIAAEVLDLKSLINLQETQTTNPDDSIRQQNPLGKIPALILEDGNVLYDSRVIVEYLDHLAGGGKILPIGEARFPVLRLQALADGIMDAGILQVYENRFRPAQYRFEDWKTYQAAKVTRALDSLEAACPAHLTQLSDADAGTIALACALGYQDVRFGGEWRKSYPKLVAWLDSFEAAVPSFAATKVGPAPIPAKEEPLR